MYNVKLVSIIAIFSFYSTSYNVNCASSVTVFSGSLEDFKAKYQSENSKTSFVSFNEKGFSLRTCKQLAEKLEGVLEVVAINCKEDPELCSGLNVDLNSYVSYPSGEKFTGDPTKVDKILEFALSFGKVYDLGSMEVFYKEFHDTLLYQKPAWLVFYCFNKSEEVVDDVELNKELNCYHMDLGKKLAIALNGTIKVGKVDCRQGSAKQMCEIAKPKISAPIVLYSYFPILQALYTLKDGATTIEKIRDLIQQDEILTSDFKEITAMIPSILDGQELNNNFFDPRFMKTKEEKEAAKKAEEEAVASEAAAKEEAIKAAEASIAEAEVVEVVADEDVKEAKNAKPAKVDL